MKFRTTRTLNFILHGVASVFYHKVYGLKSTPSESIHPCIDYQSACSHNFIWQSAGQIIGIFIQAHLRAKILTVQGPNPLCTQCLKQTELVLHSTFCRSHAAWKKVVLPAPSETQSVSGDLAQPHGEQWPSSRILAWGNIKYSVNISSSRICCVYIKVRS